jgi:hypothetical protein
MGLFKGCNESERFVRIDDENMIISVAGRRRERAEVSIYRQKTTAGGNRKQKDHDTNRSYVE